MALLRMVPLLWALCCASTVAASTDSGDPRQLDWWVDYEQWENYVHYPQEMDEVLQVEFTSLLRRGPVLQVYTHFPEPDQRIWPLIKGLVVRNHVENKILWVDPYYYIRDGSHLRCREQLPNGDFVPVESSLCYDNCIHQGRYCSALLPFEVPANRNGRELVQEALRRLCFDRYYHASDYKFFDYLQGFDQFYCLEAYDIEACSLTVIDKIDHADFINLADCVGDDLDADVENGSLEEQMSVFDRSGYGIDDLPILEIGATAYDGEWSVEAIFRAYCDVFSEMKPISCDICCRCQDVRRCLWTLQCDGEPFNATAFLQGYTQEGSTCPNNSDNSTLLDDMSESTNNNNQTATNSTEAAIIQTNVPVAPPDLSIICSPDVLVLDVSNGEFIIQCEKECLRAACCWKDGHVTVCPDAPQCAAYIEPCGENLVSALVELENPAVDIPDPGDRPRSSPHTNSTIQQNAPHFSGLRNTTSPAAAVPQAPTVSKQPHIAASSDSFPGNLPSTTLAALEDPASPQSLALEFVMRYPGFFRMPQWRKEQLFAMATFYHSYDGDNWLTRTRENWLSTTVSECSWGESGDRATQCNSLGQVTYLALASQHDTLRGTTPLEMALLSALERFEMPYNHWFTNVTRVLPTEMAQLPSLAEVRLQSTGITGTLPNSLGGFQYLQNLNLRDNYIDGPIPTEIGLLTDLKYLVLYGNYLTGTIPTELAQMNSLESLSIYANNLVGTLHRSICFLPLLRNLRLDCNYKIFCPPQCNNCACEDEQGETRPPRPRPPSPAPPGNADLAPTAAPMGLALFPTTGPASGYILNLPGFSVAAIATSFSPQSFAYQWLEDHPDLSSISEPRKQQLFALATFYYSFGGDGWDFRERENWLNYDLSECLWGDTRAQAITCDFSGSLTELAISRAGGFSGAEIPPEMALLTSLESIELEFLEDLAADLPGLIPAQLAYLPLRTMIVKETAVFGSIPSQLLLLTGLSNLNLRGNDLTGTLPTELGLLTNLEYLTLYDNVGMTGSVPSELGLLTSLQFLLIDRIQIDGPIPEEVCSLPNLRTISVNCDLVLDCQAYCSPCSCYSD